MKKSGSKYALFVFAKITEVGRLWKDIQELKNHLQILMNGLTAENLGLKNKMTRLEIDATEKKKQRVYQVI